MACSSVDLPALLGPASTTDSASSNVCSRKRLKFRRVSLLIMTAHRSACAPLSRILPGNFTVTTTSDLKLRTVSFVSLAGYLGAGLRCVHRFRLASSRRCAGVRSSRTRVEYTLPRGSSISVLSPKSA